MAVFQSKYRELAFYVGGRKHKFSNGEFTTDNEKVIAALAKVRDAKRVDVPETPEDVVDEETITEAAVTDAVEEPEEAPKPTAKGRKSSGK